MNYYEILGVSADATDQQIKEAYRREAMKWHPDRHDGAAAKAHADKKFKELALAYKTLRDPNARAAYDNEIEQKLREEYNARQREQARQRREQAQDEQARQQQARQEQNRQEFADTDANGQKESMSGDDANQMFFEQMLDLAFELAGRGFPESKITQALEALGCPDSMAKAVATLATEKSSRPKNKSSEPAIPVISAPISQAKWEDAEPYFKAVINGNRKNQILSNAEFNTFEEKYKARLNALLKIAAAALFVLTIIYFKFPKIVWHAILIALFALLLTIISNGLTKSDNYIKEKRNRKLMQIFKEYHSRKSMEGIRFNAYAFFFNITWLAYRKMYFFAFCSIFIYITVASVCYFYFKLNPEFIVLSQLGISALLSIYSYQIYYTFAEEKINKSLINYSSKAHQTLLKKYGYSSFSALLGLIITIIVFTPFNKLIESDIQQKAQKEQLMAAEKERALQAAEAEKQRAIEQEQDEANKKAHAKIKAEYDSVLAGIEARHPELNPNSPQHNVNALSWVAARKKSYQEQGAMAVDALRNAAQDYEIELQKFAAQNRASNLTLITEHSSSGNHTGTGELISLNFQNIEIRSLLQVFSEFTRISIKADDQISGSLSIRLRDIPWDEALAKVMYAKNLKTIKTGPTTLYVFPSHMSDDLAYSRAMQKGYR